MAPRYRPAPVSNHAGGGGESQTPRRRHPPSPRFIHPEGMSMWRNLINRLRRRRAPDLSAALAWEAADRRAAQRRLRDLAEQRRAEHLYDGPTR